MKFIIRTLQELEELNKKRINSDIKDLNLTFKFTLKSKGLCPSKVTLNKYDGPYEKYLRNDIGEIILHIPVIPIQLYQLVRESFIIANDDLSYSLCLKLTIIDKNGDFELVDI
jgi:hypothetical protein